MNKKYIILIITIIILIIISGFYIFSNSNNGFNNNISINANALEERGNLTVNSSNQEISNGLYSTNSGDTNYIIN